MYRGASSRTLYGINNGSDNEREQLLLILLMA